MLFAVLVLEFPWNGLGVGFLFHQKSLLRNATRLVGIRGGRDEHKDESSKKAKEGNSIGIDGQERYRALSTFQPSRHRDGVI